MKKLLFLPLVLIVSFCFAQDAKEIIGKPIKIGNLLVAQNDFPKTMNWVDAGKSCSALGKGWRLPTQTELDVLYKNRKKISNFANDWYWSSTEIENENGSKGYVYNAWSLNLYSGQSSYGNFSKEESHKLRAVRFF